jgi:very-short-patch-repair endonuclease
VKRLNVPVARKLRRASTDAELRLWRHLRNRNFAGLRFARQVPIGPYVADFVCRARKLVIELDGGQHAEQANDDAKRTAELEALGYRILRFWNNDVLTNTDSVLEAIRLDLKLEPSAPPPHPDPLPRGERGT